LDEGSAHRKASTYTGRHNTEKRGHTSIISSGIRTHEPTVRAVQIILTLDREATEGGAYYHWKHEFVELSRVLLECDDV
jgi:hypothetical protein